MPGTAPAVDCVMVAVLRSSGDMTGICSPKAVQLLVMTKNRFKRLLR